MYIKMSISSIFLALVTFFLIQLLDKLREILIATSGVGVEESAINDSLLTTNLIIMPIIFLVLSVVFYFLSKSSKKN